MAVLSQGGMGGGTLEIFPFGFESGERTAASFSKCLIVFDLKESLLVLAMR